jgi:hypothetical protein
LNGRFSADADPDRNPDARTLGVMLAELAMTLRTLRTNKVLTDDEFLQREIHKLVATIESFKGVGETLEPLTKELTSTTLPELNKTLAELQAVLEGLKSSPLLGGGGGNDEEGEAGTRRRRR